MKKYSTLITLSIFLVTFNLNGNELFDAVQEGDIERIEQLLERGYNINHQNQFGTTALDRAVKYQQIETVRYLIEQGADLTLIDNKMMDNVLDFTERCIRRSGENREKEIKEMKEMGFSDKLIENSYPLYGNDGVDYSEKGQQKWEQIHQILIEAGAKPHVPEPRKKSPPLTPEEKIALDLRLMGEYLDTGVDINMQAPDGRSILMQSVIKGSPEVVHYLLQRGINPELKDSKGRTAYDYVLELEDGERKQAFLKVFLEHESYAQAKQAETIPMEQAKEGMPKVDIAQEAEPKDAPKEQSKLIAEPKPAEQTTDNREPAPNIMHYLFFTLILSLGLVAIWKIASRRKN